MAPNRSKNDRDKMLGVLLGGAVGDAMGAPIECMRRSEIVAAFGPKGVTRFEPGYGRRGAITDDTQMTLFTLEGLIRASVRYSSRGICHPPSVVEHAYRRWLETQLGAFDDRAPTRVRRSGWLMEQHELWSRRAPGVTCISSLQRKGPQYGEKAVNDSKGAGGIMRVAPVGLYCQRPYDMAAEIAEMTHGHITSTVASGWFALAIRFVSEGASFADASTRTWEHCKGRAPELDRALAEAIRLSANPADIVPEELGEGWIAEEAAAIALWCVTTADDPLEALRLAVNIDGDSDTTGSLVGQLLGAAYGTTWIPADWLEQLELRAVIEQLADDALASLSLDAQSAEFDRFAERYPGW